MGGQVGQATDLGLKALRVALILRSRGAAIHEGRRNTMRVTYRWVVCLLAVMLPLVGIAWAAGDAAKGKAKYQEVCLSCHGASGKGDGPAAAGLPTKPRDHTDAAYMGKLSDRQIFDFIKRGGQALGKSPLMPPWGGSLTDQQIQDLVAYIRTLARRGK
jgi:cytochrome c oxidase cbb3-type subunit 3